MNYFTKNELSKYSAEFIGTAFLVAVIKLSISGTNPVLAPLTIGTCLGVLAYNWGHISWGMYNPAVTLGFALRNHPNFPLREFPRILLYWVAQFSGAFVGGMLAWLIGEESAGLVHPHVHSDYVDDTFKPMLAEAVFTALLTFANIQCVTTHKTKNNSYYGFSIGFSLFVGISSVGHITGGSFNPAVWFGTILSAELVDSDIDVWNKTSWIYIIGPFVGAIFAGLFYNLFHHHLDVEEDQGLDNSRNEQSKSGRVELEEINIDN